MKQSQFSIILFASSVVMALELTWNVTYVQNYNGRRVIGVNDAYPIPQITIPANDSLLTLFVRNSLDVPTSLHAHGLFQNGTSYYDGAAGITQCPIPPGSTFTYKIPIQQHGTYWIHGHFLGQYVDGLRAPLIIQPPTRVAKYDEEYTITLADWYIQEHAQLMQTFMSIYNPNGIEPVPDSGMILINQTSGPINFTPGKTYRLRIINIAAFAMFHVSLDGHDFTIIEVDGVDTVGVTVNSIEVATAQRFSVLVTAKNSTSLNYNFHADMNTGMFNVIPATLQLNLTSLVVYSPSAPVAPSYTSPLVLVDDSDYTPLEPMKALVPSQHISLDVNFAIFSDGLNHGAFNSHYFHLPDNTPTLLSAISLPQDLKNSTTLYGNARAIILPHFSVVELVVNNFDTGSHPFHLHGHRFQLVQRGVIPLASPSIPAHADNPSQRDTVVIPGGEFVVIRFVADNPGAWLFHCHIEWHLESGLAVTFIEAPEMLNGIDIPKDIYDTCIASGYAVSGNANGKSGTDMSGYNAAPGPIIHGWGLRGGIALAGCIASCLIGIATILWFSRADGGALPKQKVVAASADGLVEESKQ